MVIIIIVFIVLEEFEGLLHKAVSEFRQIAIIIDRERSKAINAMTTCRYSMVMTNHQDDARICHLLLTRRASHLKRSTSCSFIRASFFFVAFCIFFKYESKISPTYGSIFIMQR